MIRTKELFLFAVATLFILLAIAITLWWQSTATSDQKSGSINVFKNTPSVDSSSQFSAVINASPDIDYQEKQTEMRNKILSYREVGEDFSEIFIVGDPELLQEQQTDDSSIVEVQKCTSYSEYRKRWPNEVSMSEREGARVFYENKSSANASDSFSLDDVLLQLPVHIRPYLSSSCVTSDVIGIAKNGTLIRNSEVSTYAIFSTPTIVGYALDGFPIFGKNNSLVVDKCGGASVEGEYGYVLQDNRNNILNCYSGSPVALP